MENIFVFSAHPDDEVLGAGGTIAKLSIEGKKIYVFIFSHGDKFPPTKESEKLSRIRKKESLEADKVLGVKKTFFLGLKDTTITKHIKDKELIRKLSNYIDKYKPKSIFVHSKNDTHPDHIAVNIIVKKAVDMSKYKPPILTYEVSSILNIFGRNKPCIVIDISKTFKIKKKAIKKFKSQWGLIKFLFPFLSLKSKIIGRKYKFKYGEKFFIE